MRRELGLLICRWFSVRVRVFGTASRSQMAQSQDFIIVTQPRQDEEELLSRRRTRKQPPNGSARLVAEMQPAGAGSKLSAARGSNLQQFAGLIQDSGRPLLEVRQKAEHGGACA